MSPLFSKADLNKFWQDVQNEVTLTCAKFSKYLFSISKVIDRKTKWPRFFGLPCRLTYRTFTCGKWQAEAMCPPYFNERQQYLSICGIVRKWANQPCLHIGNFGTHCA